MDNNNKTSLNHGKCRVIGELKTKMIQKERQQRYVRQKIGQNALIATWNAREILEKGVLK